MTKDEIITVMTQEADITRKAADKALKAFLKAVSDTVTSGNKVALVGFGTFGLKERAARNGINPKTKEAMTIKAAKVPYFKASSKLKERANQANLT